VTYLVEPRLVNEAFSDPALLLDFRFGRRALLFDAGDLTPLSSREITRVTHVFVSHMHMDHFADFDRLLRLKLYQPGELHLLGPPGLADAVDAKLRAYTWNLLDEHSADFAIVATDWSEEGACRCGLFRAREAFKRREADPPRLGGAIIHEEAEFVVACAMLDHGVPSLAFAFQERLRVNVRKSVLDDLSLPVGPWLTEAKRAIRRGDPLDTIVEVSAGQSLPLSALTGAQALVVGPGQRIVYATDLAFHPANLEKLVPLARGADRLFIEAGFLEQDREIASSKRHLTARQAGSIARAAGVRHATPMHFSPRYAERESELRAEFESAFVAEDRRNGLAAGQASG
jgi:ribonuclease Z